MSMWMLMDMAKHFVSIEWMTYYYRNGWCSFDFDGILRTTVEWQGCWTDSREIYVMDDLKLNSNFNYFHLTLPTLQHWMVENNVTCLINLSCQRNVHVCARLQQSFAWKIVYLRKCQWRERNENFHRAKNTKVFICSRNALCTVVHKALHCD